MISAFVRDGRIVASSARHGGAIGGQSGSNVAPSATWKFAAALLCGARTISIAQTSIIFAYCSRLILRPLYEHLFIEKASASQRLQQDPCILNSASHRTPKFSCIDVKARAAVIQRHRCHSRFFPRFKTNIISRCRQLKGETSL